MMNFLFVHPKVAEAGEVYEFPLGLAYVSSYLRHRGFNVFCLNTCHYDDPVDHQLLECIHNHMIDVICTGGMSCHFSEISEVLDVAKSLNPKLITVVGGAIITADAELAMTNMQIDFGVIGEGEETMADLADALNNGRDTTTIKGLTFSDRKKNLIFTENRPPIPNLDILPIPDYEAFDYHRYIDLFASNTQAPLYTILDQVKPAKIITARSCPFNCTFCYHPLGKKYRQRSIDNVFVEIDFLADRFNINVLTTWDELFSLGKKRMYEFARRIKEYDIRWQPQIRVDNVDEDLLGTLKDSGVYSISYGIENLSDTILKSMQKKNSIPQIENALRLTREAGIHIIGNIILGDPAETEKTLKRSINWWLSHKEYGLNLLLLLALPDSPIYRDAVANGLIKDKLQFMKDKFPIINLTQLGDKKFKEIVEFVKESRSNKELMTVAKILFSREEKYKHNNRSCYSISLECPQCLNVSEYKNMTNTFTLFDKYFPVICRNCGMNLSVPIEKAFYVNYSFINSIKIRIINKSLHYIKGSSVLKFIYLKIFKNSKAWLACKKLLYPQVY